MKKLLILNWKQQKHPEWYLQFFRLCNISIIMVENKNDCECWGLPTHIDTLKSGFGVQKIKFTDLD